MGWADCGDDSRGRPIGYAFSATCDHPGCKAKIDRGLAHACGGMHGNEALGGDPDADWTANFPPCDQYFCGEHLRSVNLEHEDGQERCAPYMCDKCASELERLYREDADFRSLWPTDAAPLPLRTEA